MRSLSGSDDSRASEPPPIVSWTGGLTSRITSRGASSHRSTAGRLPAQPGVTGNVGPDAPVWRRTARPAPMIGVFSGWVQRRTVAYLGILDSRAALRPPAAP
jgi:hypothetical protein